MPRRPAKVTQADIARAIRAAKETGAKGVTVDSDGVIHISLRTPISAAAAASNLDEKSWTPSETLQRYTRHSESG
jgi:hypothetical protein